MMATNGAVAARVISFAQMAGARVRARARTLEDLGDAYFEWMPRAVIIEASSAAEIREAASTVLATGRPVGVLGLISEPLPPEETDGTIRIVYAAVADVLGSEADGRDRVLERLRDVLRPPQGMSEARTRMDMPMGEL